MAKQLGIRLMMGSIRIGHGLAQRKQPVSFASHRARVFCASCNAHFKHLEDAVIPFIVPMARGRALALATEAQTTLALWAAKTALALRAASFQGTDEFVPQAHRDAVRYQAQPPGPMYVGYFPWRGDTAALHMDDGTVVAVPNPADRLPAQELPLASYNVVFAFGQMGFKVTGFVQRISPFDRIGSTSPRIAQFWPQRLGSLFWPPPGTPANSSEFDDIVDFTPIL